MSIPSIPKEGSLQPDVPRAAAQRSENIKYPPKQKSEPKQTLVMDKTRKATNVAPPAKAIPNPNFKPSPE